MRLALVYPEVLDLARFRERRKEFPPFGPMYLAAAAEQAGHEVEIFPIRPGDTKRDFREFDAVGFSISASATYGLIRDSRKRSLYRPGALLMAGGVHANFYPERTLVELEVDLVGVGDGEECLVEVLEAEDRDFSAISGVWFWKDGRPVETELRAVHADLNHLPLPARHLMAPEDVVMSDRLAGTALRMAHTMFSRGCPYRCRFCAVADTGIQYRSGQSARKELVHLIDSYGIDGFAIVDDNFIINRHKVTEICQAIADLGLRWSALSRVNTVRPDLLQELRRSGCIELKFGMESGSERMLKAMGKNIKPEAIRKAVNDAYEADIGIKLFLIHGFPGEDLESTRETIELLEELAPKVERASLFRFVPLPGTYVYENPEQFALRGTDRDPDWDGDWGKYHIHHNDHHWWGTEVDFEIVEESYRELAAVVEELFPESPELPRLPRHAALARS